MSLFGKLALTLVMLALGAAPALTLASDPFLAGGREAPTPPAAVAAPSPPADESLRQGEDGRSEVVIPDLSIPRSEAEWAAWTELNVHWDEPSSDLIDGSGLPDGWVDGEQSSSAGTEGDGSVLGAGEEPPSETGLNPDGSEDGGGLLGILG